MFFHGIHTHTHHAHSAHAHSPTRENMRDEIWHSFAKMQLITMARRFEWNSQCVSGEHAVTDCCFALSFSTQFWIPDESRNIVIAQQYFLSQCIASFSNERHASILGRHYSELLLESEDSERVCLRFLKKKFKTYCQLRGVLHALLFTRGRCEICFSWRHFLHFMLSLPLLHVLPNWYLMRVYC